MKRLWLSIRDIGTILLLTILSMVVGGVWLQSWEVNRWVLPMHYFLAPLIEFMIFWPGFVFLKKRLYHDEFQTIKFPPAFRKDYFGYAGLLLGLSYGGFLLLGVRFVFPKIDGYLLAQNGASLLDAVIIAPLIEEVFFRGDFHTAH